MFFRPPTRLISSLLLAIVPALAAHAKPVTLTGSDMLPPTILSYLEETLTAAGIEWEADLKGSLLALEGFSSGDSTLAIVAVPRGRLEIPSDLEIFPLFFQAPIVLVNRDNPVREISINALRSVFASGGQPISRWEGLGSDDPDWDTRSVQAVILEDEESMVMQMFRAVVLNRRSIRTGVGRVQDHREIERLVRANAGLLVVTDRLARQSDRLVPLAIFTPGDPVPFSPTTENINFGDYPLFLPYYVVLSPEANHRVREVAGTLYSDGLHEALANEGFFPLLQSEREQIRGTLSR